MKKIFFILFITILAVPAIFPLFQNGFFSMHDNTQVERVIVMGNAIRNGQFPVRWVDGLGFGYGYPIFNFYGPLPYYTGGLLYALGMEALVATKIMIGVGFLLLTTTTFLFLRKITGNISAVVGAIAAVYFPYHAVQLYVRGAVGEFWLVCFVPLILWGIYEIIKLQNYKKGIAIGTIGIFGAILSHTLLGYATGVLLAITWFIYLLVMALRKKNIKSAYMFLIMLISGLSLSAFFWLPAIMEKGFTNVDGQLSATTQVADHFICLPQLWNSPWAFGGSIPGCIDGLSFALGKVYIVILLLGLVLFLIKLKSKKNMFLWLTSFILVFGSIFFTTKYSLFLWQFLPGFEYLQYPWRFLSYVIIGVGIFASLIVSSSNKIAYKIIVATILITVIIVSTLKYFRPQFILTKSSNSYETISNLSYNASKISDEYLPKNFVSPKTINEVPTDFFIKNDTFTSKVVEFTETYKKIEFVSRTSQPIHFNLAHFPGWRYWVNGQEIIPELDNGRPVLIIPNDFSTVQMRFIDTPIRQVGNLISLLTMLILGYIYGKKTIS